MIILISGLPRSGKSSFADALESYNDEFTHTPLDKYIKEIPEGISFLDWVDTPECIDWSLLTVHLQYLRNGCECFTPSPDWNNCGKRRSEGGQHKGGRLMRPAKLGYIIAGCHSFRIPEIQDGGYRIFIETPHAVIAKRIIGRPVYNGEAELVLNNNLSKNWRKIEKYSREADLMISGTDDRQSQIGMFMEAYNKRYK